MVEKIIDKIKQFIVQIKEYLNIGSAKFEVKKAKNKQFYFVLKAKNAEILFTSEYYTTKQNCLKGIKSVRVNSLFARVDDLS
jgi:uncharacterized protein YegP (UPF0339 family)